MEEDYDYYLGYARTVSGGGPGSSHRGHYTHVVFIRSFVHSPIPLLSCWRSCVYSLSAKRGFNGSDRGEIDIYRIGSDGHTRQQE
jgi:hypothetical protein